MATFIGSPLQRGESGEGEFALVKEADISIYNITVPDIATRDNLPLWKRNSRMEVKVISENKKYELQPDLITWTDITLSIPNNVLVESDILNAEGFIKTGLIQNLFINDAFVVLNEAAMLALVTVTGNAVIVTNTDSILTSAVYIKLDDSDPSAIGNFADITGNTGAVFSVNGLTGAVEITLDSLFELQANIDALNLKIDNNTTVLANIAAIGSLQSQVVDINNALALLSTEAGNTFLTWNSVVSFSLGVFVIYEKTNDKKAIYEVIQTTPVAKSPEDIDGINYFKEIGDYYTTAELDVTLALKADLINGKIPIFQIPTSLLGTQIVNDIAARNTLTKFEGLRVIVLDASADPNILTGSAEYVQDSINVNADIEGYVLLPSSMVGNHSLLTLDDGTNPHGTTKADVGLGSVDNTSDANKPVSTLQAAADTLSKERDNHTGTQLASTISDFAATVRDTILTGLSLVTSTAITAADSILVMAGKLQAQISLKADTDLSNVDPATGRSALDVLSTAESNGAYGAIAAVTLNTAKVTNATHTGDVTGDTVLTISSGAVDIPMLSATGTPASSTYLRGDNAWVNPAINAAVPITDGASLTLTAIKHTLSTANATITFAITYLGDDITMEAILVGITSTVFTFPVGSLCVSEGIASGNTTCTINGVSGDRIIIAIKTFGSNYSIVAKNFGQ